MISSARLASLKCIHGIDVSHYQTDIDWKQLKDQGFTFAFAKITQGATGYEGNIYKLADRIKAANELYFKLGYYHFASPGDLINPALDAKAEADNILSHLKILQHIQFPICIDLEAYAKTMVWSDKDKVTNLSIFKNTLILCLKAEGNSIIDYGNKWFDDSNKIGFPNDLWLSAYLTDPEHNLPQLPLGYNDWKIWQYSGTGCVKGCLGEVDLNIMKEDYFDEF